jgi:protein SCO1
MPVRPEESSTRANLSYGAPSRAYDRASVKPMRHWATYAPYFVMAGLVLAWTAGCNRGREYVLQGQILAIDAARHEVTIKHDDIPGFMPGMTMPFKVRNAALLDGRAPGDLIRATLVVEDSDAYLRTLQSTGRAPLPDQPPRPIVRILEPGDTLPVFEFVDEAGAPRKLDDWRGQALALTFIYTRCPVPDFCPLMDRQFAEVQRIVKSDERLRGNVHLLSLSFDPAFDTPAVLAAHSRKVGADPSLWSFLTGNKQGIEAFASRLGVSLGPAAGGAPEIVHNLRTVVIGADGRLARIFNGNEWQPSDVVSALRSALDAKGADARR